MTEEGGRIVTRINIAAEGAETGKIERIFRRDKDFNFSGQELA